jgi:exportin-5
MTLRLFISLVPEFCAEHNPAAKRSADSSVDTTEVPEAIATAIREYISMDVLQACVTSFHEPYFVELQKELASLIATIVVHYSGITATPRNVLLSLPNVEPAGLERLVPYMARPGSHTRQQRAIILDLLKDLKGVSVSEMGKLAKSTGFGSSSRSNKKTSRTKMAQAFMNEPPPSDQQATRAGVGNGDRRRTPDALEGVSNLFEH